jgi:TolB-like protein/class 3 adenylate cyclase/Tfp pilus assembly protein PilF
LSGQRVERRLAAILAADVVGYSRLIGEDEAGTLDCLRTHRRDLIDPKIVEHKGRIVKTTGDGLLVEFASVVDALRCATEWQHGVSALGAGLGDSRIEWRIGINVGDVVVENDDILGDGVNIAARLEGIADPGGICVSARVQEDAVGKLDLTFEDLGDQKLKNIARPLRVYAVGVSTPTKQISTRPVGQTAHQAAPPLSIVVLPFASLSGDPEHEYFADGITDDLTADLSRIAGSFVIARNTAFTYKGKPTDIKQIGRDLGVRYVLEGSVRRVGDQVRINVQLIDAETGANLWAERFNTSRAELDQAQDEITSRLAHTLDRELVVAAYRQIEQKAKIDPDARDVVMRGWAFWHRPTTVSAQKEARHAFEQALAMEPQSINAKVGLAATIAQTIVEGWSSSADQDEALVERLLREVLERDAHHPMARAQMGLLRRIQNRLSEAHTEVELAIALDPNNELALKQLGQILLFQGEPSAAIPHLEKAIRLNPLGPNLWSIQWPLGQCHLLLEHVDEAINLFRKACAASPQAYFLHLNLSGALGLRGDLDDARAALAEAIKIKPEVNSLARYRTATPWITNPRHWALRDRTLNLGLRRAGFPDE